MRRSTLSIRSGILAFLSAVVSCTLLLGCNDDSRWRWGERAKNEVPDSLGVPALLVREVASRARDQLVEGSAASLSRAQPGILFTVNDSGNEPFLFALDSLGADRGAWSVTSSRNIDWESLAEARCNYASGDANAAADDAVASDGLCLYIGDTGDNERRRISRTIYRVAEPNAQDSSFTGTLPADRLNYRYSDRPHDVEAMYVAPNGTIYLITKRPLHDDAKVLRPALVFAIEAPRWNRADTVVAALVDSLPIVPGSAPLRLITDASLSADGTHLAVRTYGELWVFVTDSATGRVQHDKAPRVCDIASLGAAVGEGVGWWPGRDELVLTSEGRRSPLEFVRCLRKR